MSCSGKQVSAISRQKKVYLLQLISKQHIVGDKRTHGKMAAVKQQASSFNSAGMGGHLRTVKQLLKIWDHMKQTAKKEHAIYNREVRKTGGGDPPPEVSEDTKMITDMLEDEFKNPGCEFDSDNVKPSSTQCERSGSPLCMIHVGESFEMDDLPVLTNQQGQSIMFSASSTPLHKSTVDTSLSIDGASCNFFTSYNNLENNGNMQKKAKITDWVPARASTGTTSSVGKAVLSPLENIMDLSTAKNVMSKNCMKKRKRQTKFENTPDIDVESDNQRGPSVNPKTSEGANDKLYDLLIAEAQKRVEHYENMCQEDKIRSAHTKEKQMLERRLLELKIKLAEEQLQQTRKGCGKSYL